MFRMAGHWYTRGMRFTGDVYALLDMGVQGYEAVISGDIPRLEKL